MTTTAVFASAILAIDLGKYKSVACEFHAATGEVKFRTIDTGRDEVRRLIESVGPVEVVFEAYALAGWVHELVSDFTKWPTVKHFTSWLGLCPNFKQSGGKVQSSKTRRGKNRAAHALRLAAWGLMRSKSAVGAYLRRQRSRLGAPKAITATAHKLARIVYGLVRHGWEYVRKTEEDYANEVRERLEKSLHRRAKELGFDVVKVVPPPEPAMA